jgi:hypothetical protein
MLVIGLGMVFEPLLNGGESMGSDSGSGSMTHDDVDGDCGDMLDLYPFGDSAACVTVFFTGLGMLVGGLSLSLLGAQCFALSKALIAHQVARQLRQPPLLGDRATRSGARVFGTRFGLGVGAIVALLVLIRVNWWIFWPAILAFAGFAGAITYHLAVCILHTPLSDAQTAAVSRASLRAKAGVLRLRLGDAEGAAARLGEAQAELEHAVGVNP